MDIIVPVKQIHPGLRSESPKTDVISLLGINISRFGDIIAGIGRGFHPGAGPDADDSIRLRRLMPDSAGQKSWLGASSSHASEQFLA